MRLGLIARADNSGLGIQTLEFYKAMKPDKTMVVDISDYNKNKIYPDRYPDGILVHGFPRAEDINTFLQDLDVVFIAESAYNPYLYTRARELGVKTAVQYNYEFFDWYKPDMPKPDMLIAPSRWHYKEVDDWAKQNGVKHIYLHCPVNREVLPKKEIKQARIFLHNAGRSASHDRNGTQIVIAASRFLKTDAQILIHFQGEQGLAHQTTNTIGDYADYLNKHGDTDKVSFEQIDFENYQDTYKEGDVLLLPRRYGGNCLPMNEALSVGMPVIMSAISPNDELLPDKWLLPALKINEFTPRTTIDIYDVSVIWLAGAIDTLYKLSEEKMITESQQASNIADTISWGVMKPEYTKALESLCKT